MESNEITLFPSQWEISYIFPLSPLADFQISDLEVKPSEVKTGEEVTVLLKITNVGGQTGSYTIQLIVNQTIENTKPVTLDKGSSSTTEFKIIKQIPGIYKIEVDGLVARFTVSEASSKDTPSNLIPLKYNVSAAVSVVGIILIIFLIFRKRGYNIKKIFRLYPRLNKEEKDVIQFLAENNGKDSESQIRDKFLNVPRTSLWRLVK